MIKRKNIAKQFINLFAYSFLLTFLLIPRLAVARVEITEIMYDLIGADAGREWIEVYNATGEDVDLSTYRFLENNVNHRISIYNPNNLDKNNILPAGVYAVIADGPVKFLVDHPGYSGLLFNSSFSLRDGGEELSIVNPDGEIDFSVHYLPEWGARATGNSLQWNGEKWIPAVPTPGQANATVAVNEDGEDSSSGTGDSGESSGGTASGNQSSGQNLNDRLNQGESSHSGQNSLSNFIKAVNLKAGSGRVRYGIINSPIKFEALSNYESLIKSEDNLKRNVRYEWSFGDTGASLRENPTHYYHHEGEYNIVLNARFDGEQAISRNRIVIRRPNISIMLITSGEHVDIMLENNSDFEVNFGYFFLKLMDEDPEHRLYIFPEDTILNANSAILIPSILTGFLSQSFSSVILYYPNGNIAAEAQNSRFRANLIFQKISPHVEVAKHPQLRQLLELFVSRQQI